MGPRVKDAIMRGVNPIDVPSSVRNRRRRSGARIILLVLVLLAASLAAWTWLTLSWSYSDGYRAGVVQKFSRRGWLCKTFEGDLAQFLSLGASPQSITPGMTPQVWKFSVRDPQVAKRIEDTIGREVQLHYTEHAGVPISCFADSRYFVDSVNVAGSGSAAK